MTVETTTRKQNFTGGQAELEFAFRALPESPEDIKCLAVDADEVETELEYDVDYTVVVNSDGIGGTVTVNPTFATTYTHTVYRDTTVKQESDYDDYNPFPADTLETNIDRLTMVAQENKEAIERCIKMPISSEDEAPSYVTIIEESAEAATTAAEEAEISASEALASKEAAETAETNAVNAADEVVKQMFQIIIDGGGSAINVGIVADVQLPFAGAFTGWSILADQSGSIAFDLWKDTYANFPPTNDDSIVAAANPNITTATKATGNVSGWAEAVFSAGDIIRINVDSCTSIEKCSLILNYTRTI